MILERPQRCHIKLEAGSNGRVELPNLTNVTGNVEFYAHHDNAIATINCPRLDHISYGTHVQVHNGGTFIGAPLVDVSGGQLTIHDPLSVFDTSHIVRMDDALRVFADGGATATFPGITTYTTGVLDCPQVGVHALQAKNPGTRLVFPALTSINSACPTGSILVQCYKSPNTTNSGEVHMPALTSMSGRVDIVADASGLIELGMADLAANAVLSIQSGAELRVLGSMRYATTNPMNFAWGAGSTLRLTGGTGGNCVSLEAAGLDKGNVPAGWTSNFQLQRLVIGPGARVRLVDNINNAHRGGIGGQAETLYVDTLEFADATGQLGRGGLHVYYKTLVGSPAQIVPVGCAVPHVPDFDHDGDVDSNDVDAFKSCASGPAIPIAPACQEKDLDGDGDADGDDFGILQRCYKGSNPQNDPNCGV